ncbi:MAG TPA: class IV adenylate cyclase [Planctomycetota bacterium]|nr:class IV adenylate cyclase [Planctomycetota bacterium]
MARNVEIKARIESVEALARRAQALADRGPEEIVQDDTFFRCEEGRLKLRAFPSGAGELIFYRRPDARGPKESFYVIAPVADAGALRRVLSLAYQESGRVRKVRRLYLVGRARVHLDRVEGLGEFLELEVVLSEGEPARSGIEEATELMARLGVERSQCVEGAYVDLLRG